VTVTTPYDLSYAHVAWDHGTTIIGIEKGGSDIGQPVAYSASAVGSFTSFHNLAHTWSVATDFDLINAGGHVRVITGINNASYLPVVASWNGTGFTSRTLTGYLSGGPSPTSHDPSTDRSGRLVDVSEAAGPKVVVSNLVDDRHAALFSFPAGGTLAGTVPQVATTARGRGWVMWGVEDGSVGTKLRIVPIRLAGLHKTVTKYGLHGSVTLTGPASCLPASAISIKARGHAKSGWKAHAAKLLLGTKGVASPLNGAALTAAKSYTLKGVVVFSNKKHPHRHSKVTAALPFRTCPNP